MWPFSEFVKNYKPTHVLRSTYLKVDKDKPHQDILQSNSWKLVWGRKKIQKKITRPVAVNLKYSVQEKYLSEMIKQIVFGQTNADLY